MMFSKEDLNGLEFYHKTGGILYRLELDYDGLTYRIVFDNKTVNNYKYTALLKYFNDGTWIPTKESLLKLKFKYLL